MSLVEFLLARIAEDEAWANACEGLHWEWRGNDLDDLVTPDPLLDEYIDGDSVCSLRSVETFPYQSIPGEGPRFLISSAEETQSTAAGHIVRWDPDRVLAECAAKRRIVQWYQWGDVREPVLGPLAAVYADHPDYDQSWSL